MTLYKNALKPSLTATAVLFISACQAVSLPSLPNFSAQPVPGPEMPPAQLPSFSVGDSFIYSNGWYETIVGIDGEALNMINKSKRKISNFRNFTLPTPYIEGKDKEFLKSSNVPTNTLWPLRVGNTSKFSTQGRSISKATGQETSYIQRWSCAVEGTERITIRAGEFDTYRVKCQRFTKTGRWWQNRTWNYAPMLGTYVLRRDYHKTNGVKIRELTAIRPSLQDVPKNVRSGIIYAWQSALENKVNNDISSWTDKVTGTSVQVEPLATTRADNGEFCRTYKQYLTRKGMTRIYSGIACRKDKMKWYTPRKSNR